MNILLAKLLLVCDEEDVFWIMRALIERYLPAGFYNEVLCGLQGEVKLVRCRLRIQTKKCNILLLKIEIQLIKFAHQTNLKAEHLITLHMPEVSEALHRSDSSTSIILGRRRQQNLRS